MAWNIGVSQAGGGNIGVSQTDPTSSINVSITADLLSLTGSISTPTISTTSNINFSPSALSLLASIYSPTITSPQNIAISGDLLNISSSIYSPIVLLRYAVLSGTILSSTNESDIVTGGKTIVLTLVGATWVE